ncbi:MAG: AAA domain-containing protein [Candidatus Tectimicrobiota bacterium]
MTSSTPPHMPERPLSATRLAHYATVRGRCERYLRLALFPSEGQALMQRYGVRPEVLSPLLAEAGSVFEHAAVAQLAAEATVIDLRHQHAQTCIDTIRSQPVGRVLYAQATLAGRVGAVDCEGIADVLDVVRRPDQGLEIMVIDIKASRRNSVSFCLQIALYARLLADALARVAAPVASRRGAILARGEAGAPAALEPFDLALFEDDIARLLATSDSDVQRVLHRPLAVTDYHLSAKCDGCPYNALCFIDTAERDDLSLVPLLTATDKRALQRAGVTHVRQLATLMDYGPRAMVPALGREQDLARLSTHWPLGGRLPALVQRARAAVQHADAKLEAKPFLLGSGFGSLPDPQRYPDLVKVFIDAQHDYIADRVYLLTALVAGPAQTAEVVEMTSAPPDTEAEQTLLITWLTRLLPAIAAVAGATQAPLHIYLYDQRDQGVLLTALTRHFDALCAIPAFYDLLTASSALTQGMLSFLADDMRERRNLAPICQNLYRVASALGFAWREGELDFWRTFRARAFGYRRLFVREAATGLFRQARREDEAGAIPVEAAARFGTQIPLEYAYAAWGHLALAETASPAQRAQLRGFLGVTGEDIRQLAAQRCRALHYLEQQFTPKNRRVDKAPFDLTRLDQVAVEPEQVPLHRALEDFLLLEHHAKHQAAMLFLAQPPELRAQTGQTAVVRCERYDRGDRTDLGVFVLADVHGAPITREEMGDLRLQEGAWVVVNSLYNDEREPRAAWELVRGRLGIIRAITATQLTVQLQRLSFRPSPFRYAHRRTDLEPGHVYTLDEMVDDLNTDKYLEACQHTAANPLYHWLSNAYTDPQAPKPLRAIRPSRLRAGQAFADLAARAQPPFGLTAAQRAMVGGYYPEQVLVVQGPPGTGKSHTLGLAILARAWALQMVARPFRVAVAAKTHAAVSIVLDSVAQRLRDLLAGHAEAGQLDTLNHVRIAKVCHAMDEPVPAGVEALLADGDDTQSASEQWQALLAEPLVIVGGTPGGLYRLIKQGAARGRQIDWSAAYFDLVVVDEASQMSLPEALTAAAFLRDDGQFIAVGDHRQMPPILHHAWDQASRRDLARARPHLSLFAYLLELGFVHTALDESFRLPAEVAAFLHRHVYARDGIAFHSQNRQRLPAVELADGWLRHALAPEHPMILIEHNDDSSQQANACEAMVIEALAQVACAQLGLDSKAGLGIVVPHRAQKAVLQTRLPHLAGAVDTVERFQGGERDLIIVSATVSDLAYAQSESDFLLEPRRLTVAVSRPKRKLIVLASQAIFTLMPADLDDYERGALWKCLRHACASPPLWTGEYAGYRLRVYTVQGT